MSGHDGDSAGGRSAFLTACLGMTAVLLLGNLAPLRGEATAPWDGYHWFEPYHRLVAEYAANGRLLTWNPLSNGGAPDWVDPQVGALSPVHLAVALLAGSGPAGFVAYWLAMWWLGGLGLMLLARHLDAGPGVSLAVTLGWLFSGFWTGHAEHTAYLATAAFLPLVIWRLDASLLSGRIGPAAEAGVLWGLSALAGYPGVVMVVAGMAVAWAAGRWLAGTPVRGEGDVRRPGPGSALRALVVLLGIGIVVLSPTYYGFLREGVGYSDRAGPLPRAEAIGSNALDPGTLATFAAPELPALKLLGRPGLWAATDVSSCSVWLGPLIPALAFFGLVFRPRDRWRWWLAGLAAAGLVASMGEALPVRGWLYDLVPPTRYFRHANVFRLASLFALAVLALEGAKDLGDRRAGMRLLVVSAALALVAGGVYFGILASGPGSLPFPGLGRLHLVAVWLGLVAVGAFVALDPHARRRAAVPTLLVALAAGDALLTARLTEFTRYGRGPYVEVAKRTAGQRDDAVDLTARGLDRLPSFPDGLTEVNNTNLPLGIPTLENYSPFRNRFHRDLVLHPALVEMATRADRLWFSSEVAEVGVTDAAWTAFVRRVGEIGAPVLVVHAREDLLHAARPGEERARDADDAAAIARLPAAKRVAAALERYGPDELTLTVDCPTDGWLLVTDRWSRAWRATVDGTPSPVLGGNFIFRALGVHAGSNRIRFTYHPPGLPGLLMLSWGVVLLTSIVAVRRGVGRRR